MSVFQGAKYDEASQKALEFIKAQMDVSQWLYTVNFAEDYADSYANNLIWGTVQDLPNEDEKIFPKHINVDSYYGPDYEGVVSGIWFGLPDTTGYSVEVYAITDIPYFVLSCPLRADGTWRSQKYVTVTETDPETGEEYTYSYWEDIPVGKGFKEFRLVKDGVIIDYPYSRFVNFKVRLFSFVDAEYLSDEMDVWDMGGGRHVFYTQKVFSGLKIAKVIQRVWQSGSFNYIVVGISGARSNSSYGRLPASFYIPTDDPQYDKEGNSALGAYGYMLNSRCWAYDVGLALLVFTVSGDYELCKEILNRMEHEQGADGSFNFSYDIYIGQLFEGYIRTGAIGWTVWGMCYYTLITGDRSFMAMITKASDWLLSRQVTNRDDLRYGLLTGGYGSYNMDDYSYDPAEIKWCSTEHQCSALQALHGASLLTGEDKYKVAADKMKEQLVLTLYDTDNERFYQGCSAEGVDEAWALDCTTWAGKSALSILSPAIIPPKCRETTLDEYLVTNETIYQSSEPEYYNQTYSLDGVTEGFKPYSSRGGSYDGAPELVWTEGTLGYVTLCISLGKIREAKRFLDATIDLQNCNNSPGGVIYTTKTYASLPWEFHVWPSVVSSAWLYLLIENPDCLFPIVTRHQSYAHKMQAYKESDRNNRIVLYVYSDVPFTYYVPISGGEVSGRPFDWRVDWGDGTSGIYEGVSSMDSSVNAPNHTYPAGEYQITIRPNSERFSWASAFGYSEFTNAPHDSLGNKYLLIGVDMDISPNMTRTVDQLENFQAPDNEWTKTFINCRFLRNMHDTSFVGWEGITTVGNFFMMGMFSSCQRLQMGEKFQLPQSLITAGNFFCSYLFTGCPEVSMNGVFQMPQRLRTSGHSLFSFAFFQCTNLVVNSMFLFPRLDEIPELAFSQSFNGIGASQHREAMSIINGLGIPEDNRYTFSSTFSDYSSLPEVWKGV